MGFFRAAEPTGPSWVEGGADDGWEGPAAPTGHRVDTLDAVAEALWEPQMQWLGGSAANKTMKQRTEDEIELLGRQLNGSGSEATRMTAAGALAHTAGGAGLPTLVEAAGATQEAAARSACYGLAKGEDGAVAPLISLLAAEPPPPPPGSASSSVLPDRPFYRKDKLAFAVGRAATSAESLTMAVEALAAACERARADVRMLVSGMSSEEKIAAVEYAASGGRGYGGDTYSGKVIPDQRSDDARGLLMEAGRSLGLLGSKAVALDLKHLSVRIAELLIPVVTHAPLATVLPPWILPDSLLVFIAGEQRGRGSDAGGNSTRKTRLLELGLTIDLAYHRLHNFSSREVSNRLRVVTEPPLRSRPGSLECRPRHAKQ